MAIAGEAGVRHVMKSLLADFDILMNCAGASNIKDIKKAQLSESLDGNLGSRLMVITEYVEGIGGLS